MELLSSFVSLSMCYVVVFSVFHLLHRSLFASMHSAVFETSRRYSVQFRRARLPQRSGWGYDSSSVQNRTCQVEIFPGETIFLCDTTVVNGFVPSSVSEVD